MTQVELQQKLDELIAGWENECVEFKETNDNYSTSDIGKYFSALANEANLKTKESGWLVFGVRNRDRSVVGTTFREERERLHATKKQIADGTDPSTTFREIHELTDRSGSRVVMLEVPPAPRGMPIGWNGHYYARDHESLAALSIAKLDEIRAQTAGHDWSAGIVASASLADLDPDAITKARDVFRAHRTDRFPDGVVDGWSDTTFLENAKLTINGSITRAALLLLGKHTCTHFINPQVAELSWKLEGPEQAYEHFGPPFLLTTSRLYQRIRNITLKFLPAGQLVPKEVPKYDQKIVLEALHNCIAHQDYTRCERVLVIERPDELIFRNAGGFIEGTVDDYVLRNRTPTRYRNKFLAEAMVNLRMMDTLGYGIREVMFKGQAGNYRPLPFYQNEGPHEVEVHLPGRFIDENYSRLLLANPDLQLADIIALDRIQKHLTVPAHVLKELRKRGWVEGHKPNIHISAAVASTTGQKASYIRTRKQDDDYYKKLVLDFLEEWVEGTPKDMRDLLLPKLSDGLTDAQKRHKVRNLLTAMRKEAQIVAVGVKQAARWRLPFGYGPAPAKPPSQ